MQVQVEAKYAEFPVDRHIGKHVEYDLHLSDSSQLQDSADFTSTETGTKLASPAMSAKLHEHEHESIVG